MASAALPTLTGLTKVFNSAVNFSADISGCRRAPVNSVLFLFHPQFQSSLSMMSTINQVL